jgi:hypothetical protein
MLNEAYLVGNINPEYTGKQIRTGRMCVGIGGEQRQPHVKV